MLRGAIAHLERVSFRRLMLSMVLVFAAVQTAYALAGVRYDMSTLVWFMQFLEPDLLRTRLLESLWYLHSQPPLFNLFLGIVVKLVPGHEALLFQAIFLACGLVLYISLYLIQIQLGIARWLAFVLSTVFMASPTFVLYENWLFYTFPLATLMTLSIAVLQVALKQRRWGLWSVFFFLLFLLIGIRSFFHLIYFLFAAATVIVACRSERRRILAAAAIPFVLVLILYGKNYLLFGKFTTSTWLGQSVWTMTTRNIPLAERREMVARGEISEISLVDRFGALAEYPAVYRQAAGYPAVPALQRIAKASGFPNYNHPAYIAISDQYLQDALYTLRYYPRTFVIGTLRAWYSYFRPGSDYVFLRENRQRIVTVDEIFNYVIHGKLPYDLSQLRGVLPIYSDYRGNYLYLFLLFGLPLIVLNALRLLVRPSGEEKGLAADQRLSVLLICFNILYVTFVGNALETGENNRFRFMVDPLFVVLLSLLLHYRLLSRWRWYSQGDAFQQRGTAYV